MTALGDLMVVRGGSVNPALFPDEEFELYSIPAHDRGGPELVVGSDIGSAKQVVQANDVMISKIIPHIRRARVVGAGAGRRQIASGEWIVFRDERFEPGYLRHFLLSDGFHAQFMNTVAGVGGSLVRARPQQVKSIDFPMPDLAEQRRIAAILDHADALRAKRRQVLAHLDALTQSIFHDMFGRRDDQPQRLDSLVDSDDRMNYGVVQPGDHVPGGVPLIRVSDLVDGAVDRRDLKRISPEIDDAYRRSRITGTEVLVSSVGTIGRISLASHSDVGSNLARAITRVPITDPVMRSFVACYLRSDAAQRYFTAELRTVAQPTLNVKQLAATKVPLPPAELRRTFVHRIEQISATQAPTVAALVAVDELFASLQSRAFTGEL